MQFIVITIPDKNIMESSLFVWYLKKEIRKEIPQKFLFFNFLSLRTNKKRKNLIVVSHNSLFKIKKREKLEPREKHYYNIITA